MFSDDNSKTAFDSDAVEEIEDGDEFLSLFSDSNIDDDSKAGSLFDDDFPKDFDAGEDSWDADWEKDFVDDPKAVFDSDILEDVNIDVEGGESSVDENEKNVGSKECFDSEISYDVIDNVCIDFEAANENLVFDSEPLDGVGADDETLFDSGFDSDDVSRDIEEGICSADKEEFCFNMEAGNESSVSVSDAQDSIEADDNTDDSCDIFSNDETEDDTSFVENEGCNFSEQEDLDCFSSFLELDNVWTFESKLDKSEYLGWDCTVQCTLVEVDVPKPSRAADFDELLLSSVTRYLSSKD